MIIFIYFLFLYYIIRFIPTKVNLTVSMPTKHGLSVCLTPTHRVDFPKGNFSLPTCHIRV